MSKYDVIIIGSGAAGMMAGIIAGRNNNKVLLLEQQANLGPKLKATGGGRCNLSNTLTNEDFMNSFGRNGKFMYDALNLFDFKSLIKFFDDIGVKTHIPDGFRIFPVTHSSSTILKALKDELLKQSVEILTKAKVTKILCEEDVLLGVQVMCDDVTKKYLSTNIIVATGGLGYPMLGANGDGYEFAKILGHKITDLYPAMLPLLTKETWVNKCRADTIAKAQLKINLPKAKKLKACGDLIFTSKGIRGPVVLDFSREITPYLDKYEEVPILVHMLKGMNEEELRIHLTNALTVNIDINIEDSLKQLLPLSVICELCNEVKINSKNSLKSLKGEQKDSLIKILISTPLTVTASIGFKQAMITRGGVKLKEINPKTMESKLVKGLYFCGEIVDLDGPCGGYNLQWSFASGNLAGMLLSN